VQLSEGSDDDYGFSRSKSRKQPKARKAYSRGNASRTSRPKRARFVSDEEDGGDQEEEEEDETSARNLVELDISDDDYFLGSKGKLKAKGNKSIKPHVKKRDMEPPSRETRTSRRSVARKSYAEAEESDEENVKKQIKVFMDWFCQCCTVLSVSIY
jgi:hypothetical protein